MANEPKDIGTEELGKGAKAVAEARGPRKPREEVPTQIGPYKILEQIGVGGMGLVYLAEQSKPLHRRVALKVIKRGMDTQQVVARFEVEREALALMNHPHVAKVFDAGETDDGRPYFVMEYVAGISITHYCDRNTLSTEDRLRLFIEVCRAVRHAHQKGIIHRDIKPSNVLVMVQDGKPVPKVIDFGVAKATQRRLTEDTVFTGLGQLIGTPGYMSPEQAEMTALDVDQRTDVYSLGVLLYELLVGALPFDTDSWRHIGIAEMQRIIREVEPPRPSTRFSSLGKSSTAIAQKRRTEAKTLSRQLRGDLDWIAMKCLEKDRTRRYDSAEALATDLECYLNQQPVIARPPSASYRLSRFAKRHRKALATSAVCVVLTAAAVFSLSQWRSSVLAVQQEKASSLFHQGMLDAQSRPDTAIAKFDQAAALLPGYIEPRVQKAVLLKRENRHEEAMNAALALINERPDRGPAHLLAQLYSDRDVAKAAIHRAEGQRLLPNDRYYTAISLGPDQNPEAIALLTAFLEEEGTHFDARWVRAWRYFNVRNYDAMLDDADFLIKARSKYASAWNLNAVALSRLRQEEKALQAYGRAIALAPDHAPTYVNRADLLVRMGRTDEALLDCNEALKREPKLGFALAERAWVYMNMDWRSEAQRVEWLNRAETDCREALSADEQSAYAWHRLGVVHTRREDYPVAEAAITQAIEIRPELINTWTDRAEVRFHLGRFSEAIEDLNRARELDPTDEIVLSRRALVHERLRSLASAEGDLSEAIRLNPRFWDAYDNRARIRRSSGDFDGAMADHELAIGGRSKPTSSLVGRGITHRFRNNDEAALADFEAAIALSPHIAILTRLWAYEILMLTAGEDNPTRAAQHLHEAKLLAQPVEWKAKVVALFDQPTGGESLLEEAGTNLRRRCAILYALGVRAMIHCRGDEARRWFEGCVNTAATDTPELELARLHLARNR